MAAFFWPVVTPIARARRYFGRGDFTLQFFPFHRFAASQLAAGRLALWDPYMYSGHPFQADLQTAVLYPIAVANEWLSRGGLSFLALEWEAIVHFGLAATFTLLLIRLLTGSTLAGLLGAVAFTFGGFLTSYPSQQLPVLESTVWLPLELYCLERAARCLASTCRAAPARSETGTSELAGVLPGKGWEPSQARRSSLWLAAAGACVGLALLAGHPQTVLYLAYLGAAYFLFRMPWRSWWRAGWPFLTAVGLSAAQLLPSLQLFAVNHKGKLAYSFAAGGMLPRDLPGLVLDWPSGGRILYLGILPLGLALLAVIRLHDRRTFFWLGVALVAPLLSLGTHGPLFHLFFVALPGWDLFRDQERAVVLFAMAGSVLGGYGLAALLQWMGRATKALPGSPGSLAVPAAGCLIVLAAWANLFLTNQGNNLSSDPPPTTSSLSRFLAPVSADRDIFRVRVSQGSIEHNAGNLLKLQFVSGDSPFEPRSFQRWTQDGPWGARVTEWQLLRLTNSHYVVSSRALCQAPCTAADGLRLLGTRRLPARSRLLDSTATGPAAMVDLRLYQVRYPLPRAFFASQATAVSDQRQAIQEINRPHFDAQRTVLIQGPIQASVGQASGSARASGAGPPGGSPRADVVGYAPGFVDMRTSSKRAAYLFVSEVAYPGWQATVDGRSVRLYTADGLFDAVHVSAGKHHVVLRYVPTPFFIGAAISVLTALCLALAAALSAAGRGPFAPVAAA